jgi:hypothetical protein
VDLKKAFDRVRLTDVIDCLREKEVPEQIVRIIKELNTDTIAQIKSNNQTSSPITITNGIRQGDSLSPLLFSLIIYKIIADLPHELYGLINICQQNVRYAFIKARSYYII